MARASCPPPARTPPGPSWHWPGAAATTSPASSNAATSDVGANMSNGEEISRRQALAVTVAAAAATVPHAALAQVAKAGGAPAAGKFFTPYELALLDEVAELIIPADAQSGGARAARCADYIDARLAESIDPGWRQSWK